MLAPKVAPTPNLAKDVLYFNPILLGLLKTRWTDFAPLLICLFLIVEA